MTGHGDESQKLRRRSRVTPPPMFHCTVEGGWEGGRGGCRSGSWGSEPRDGLGELGHADGGYQNDDPRGAKQPPDHGQLDHCARQRSDGQGGDQRQPVRPVMDPDHDRQQSRGRHPEVPDGEVDDSARAVDEHDAHGDEGDDHSLDRRR